MERRDYLIRQLEQMMKVIGVLIGKLLGFKPEELPSAMDYVRETMRDDLHIDFDALIEIPTNELPQHLLSDQIKAELFDNIAEVLFRIGELHMEQFPGKAKDYFERAMRLYSYLDTESGILSFGRSMMISKVKEKLQQVS